MTHSKDYYCFVQVLVQVYYMYINVCELDHAVKFISYCRLWYLCVCVCLKPVLFNIWSRDTLELSGYLLKIQILELLLWTIPLSRIRISEGRV